MRVSTLRKWQARWLCAGVMATIAILGLGLGSCTEGPSDAEVLRAYELRMDGKADEAKELLDRLLAENPAQAAAHYELARTLIHLGLAAPRELMSGWEAIEQSIAKAVEHDPENVIYRFFGGRVAFYRAYMALQQGDPAAAEPVRELCRAYESVLESDAGYHEAALYLVEICGSLPPERGGDSAKAEAYAQQLEAADEVWGAKARSLLTPEGTDMVAYWEEVLARHAGNAAVLHELGRAHLFREELEPGLDFLEQAMDADSGMGMLALDIARAHLMRGMQDRAQAVEALPRAEQAIERYLTTSPSAPMRAYAMGLRLMAKRGELEEEALAGLRAEIEAIDPYYSKAFGIPTADLFVAPDEPCHHHRYLFAPL